MHSNSANRSRRHYFSPLSPTHHHLLASDSEVSKDLQHVLHCPSSLPPAILSPPTPPKETASLPSKVLPTQRKRTPLPTDSDSLDAILGLATFVCEGESLSTVKKAKTIEGKNSGLEGKSRNKPAAKAVLAGKQKRKQSSVQQGHRKSTLASSPAPDFSHLPYTYPYMLTNYLYPFIDRSQPSFIPNVGIASSAVYSPPHHPPPPAYGVMIPAGTYGPVAGWPGTILSPVVGGRGTQQVGRVYKRAARHVAIAIFIRGEEFRQQAIHRATLFSHLR